MLYTLKVMKCLVYKIEILKKSYSLNLHVKKAKLTLK